MTPTPSRLYVLLDRVRSAFNVGSIFRIADSAGIDKLYLGGYCAIPPHPKLAKTALGSTTTVPWEHHCDPIRLAKLLKQNNVRLIALEPIPAAKSIYDASITSDTCLIFGHEETGISQELLALVDDILKIPQYGVKESLNVSVAAGIAIYEAKRQVS